MKLTKRQLRKIIKEYGTYAQRTMMRGRYPSTKPDYGEGNLTLDDVRELLPRLSSGEQVDVWEKYSHLNNKSELARELEIQEAATRKGDRRAGGGQHWGDGAEDLDEQGRYDDPGSRPSWEDDASHPDSPDYDEGDDDFYEWRHQEDQIDMEYYIAVSLEQAARNNPGIDGKGLLRIAREDPEYAPLLKGVTDTRMFEVADSMIEEETLFFDVEEDAWYYAPDMDLRESTIIKEYEQYVDEEGNVWDDEGNVTRRGSKFGQKYGGQTYTGTRPPWSGRGSSGRKTTYVGADANAEKMEAISLALDKGPNKFLSSIYDQLVAGRGLSTKQNAIVRKILLKNQDYENAKLFENNNIKGKNMKVSLTRKQLRRIIREAETAAAENAALIGVESPYEVEPVEDAWAGGDDLINPIDQAEAAGSEAVTPEQEILDVTEDTLDEIAGRLQRRLKIKKMIKEAISGASVRTQQPFIDVVISSLQAGDPVTAANAVMDSYMIDDVFPEEEDALVDVLGGLPYDAGVEQIEMAADAWLENYRAGRLRR